MNRDISNAQGALHCRKPADEMWMPLAHAFYLGRAFHRRPFHDDPIKLENWPVMCAPFKWYFKPKKQGCEICGLDGETSCTPQSNCLNIPVKP